MARTQIMSTQYMPTHSWALTDGRHAGRYKNESYLKIRNIDGVEDDRVKISSQKQADSDSQTV